MNIKTDFNLYKFLPGKVKKLKEVLSVSVSLVLSQTYYGIIIQFRISDFGFVLKDVTDFHSIPNSKLF
jgi:hypothetical protein